MTLTYKQTPGLSPDEKAAVLTCTTADVADEIREANIKTCGVFLEQALSEGRRATAIFWMGRMTQGINARSVQQVARLEAEYFGARGEADWVAMQGRAAA